MDTDGNETTCNQQRKQPCPKVEPVNNNIGHLTHDQKLKIVEKDVQNLYQFCIANNFTNEQVLNCVAVMRGGNKSLASKIIEDTAKHFIALSKTFY